MNAVQYILVNKGAGMGVGKTAAQASHAAVQSYRTSKQELVDAWLEGGHYSKIVLEVPDERALLIAEKYITNRGFRCELIIDEGRTEIDAMTPTALAVEIVDKDLPHVRKTFENYSLFRDRGSATDIKSWEKGYDNGFEAGIREGLRRQEPQEPEICVEGAASQAPLFGQRSACYGFPPYLPDDEMAVRKDIAASRSLAARQDAGALRVIPLMTELHTELAKPRIFVVDAIKLNSATWDGIKKAYPETTALGLSLWGYPVVLDDTIPPGEFKLRQ